MKQIAILGCIILSLTQVLVAGPTNSPAPKTAVKQSDYDKFFAETEKLPPAERQAKINEFFKSHGLSQKEIQKHHEEFRKITPEQRRAKLQNRLDDLRKKKTTGTITAGEQSELKNLEGWSKRTQQTQAKSSSASTNNPIKPK